MSTLQDLSTASGAQTTAIAGLSEQVATLKTALAAGGVLTADEQAIVDATVTALTSNTAAVTAATAALAALAPAPAPAPAPAA